MKINKIILYNFSSFEGMNEFDFSATNEEKNIILIGGKNGAGKTSLFTAIKIALYGPLAFGYVGANSHYISKIKECINSKTFQKNKVEAKVQINISLMDEREVKEYEITREWDYNKRKLTENYYVKVDGKMLDMQDLSSFQNYLQGLIPPDLFEFFLFDGEEVGSIFATSTYNSYIKNAVYTLCGLDMFEIIRKYTHGYIGKAATKDEEVLHRNYEELRQLVEDTENARESLESDLSKWQLDFDNIDMTLIELKTLFKNAGGIAADERKRLTEEYEEAEHIKAESGTRIKLFMEGLMPFFIVNEFSEKILNQLDYEEKSEIFYYIQQKLNKKEMQEILGEKVPDNSIDKLMEMLLLKFRPKGFGVESIFDLSKEDISRVNAMITSLKDFDVEAMVETVKQKQQALDREVEINRILKNAMSDDELAEFTEKEKVLLQEKQEVTQKLYEGKIKFEELSAKLNDALQQRNKAWQIIKDNAKNKHVFELSSGLSTIMESLLSEKTIEIRKKMELLIVQNLQHLYRKNNLITHIEIGEDFQFNLYQDATYTADELVHLIKNLGRETFAITIGRYGQEVLFKRYGVTTMSMLQKALAFDSSEEIRLYKNIDLGRLSKGERQIFILALYWAIIELSGENIPFVIDTPYARIDANHRKEISEKFFPNISNQVVILSTDEEINEEYYKIIKPHIAKEYLLINDESQNRTSVENGYFFGV